MSHPETVVQPIIKPTSVMFELVPGKKPHELKFTVDSVDELEQAASMGIEMLRLRGQTVRSLILLLTYGLKHQDPGMTESRAKKILQRFVDRGGNAAELMRALVAALNQSGVYGHPDQSASGEASPKPDQDDEGDGEEEETPPTDPLDTPPSDE